MHAVQSLPWRGFKKMGGGGEGGGNELLSVQLTDYMYCPTGGGEEEEINDRR